MIHHFGGKKFVLILCWSRKDQNQAARQFIIITGFSECFHRPVFLWVEGRRFGNWICFRHQVKGERRQLGPLERPNLNRWNTRRVSTPKNTGRCKQSKRPSNSVCYTPSSQPYKLKFAVYRLNMQTDRQTDSNFANMNSSYALIE
jgi:hypothetical protein